MNLKSRRATIIPMDKDRKLYEITYLISPALAEEEASGFHQDMKNYVQSLGGLVDSEGEILKRRLSYPIKKMSEAYVANFRIILEPARLDELKSKMNRKEILRFLATETVRYVPPKMSFKPRVIKEAPQAKTVKEPQPKPAPQEIQAANIEEIDKKLEEILGK